jgi:hypothetical protein
LVPSTEILIGDPGGQHVLIRPLSRNHPGLFDGGDANWIDCELQIVAGGFRGAFRSNLRSEEFRTFLEEAEGLSRTLQGTASFATMEGQLALSLSGDGKGHLRVSGEAIDEAGSGNRLQFGFDIDQTYLPAICRSLEYLLAAFPVISTPDG